MLRSEIKEILNTKHGLKINLDGSHYILNKNSLTLKIGDVVDYEVKGKKIAVIEVVSKEKLEKEKLEQLEKEKALELEKQKKVEKAKIEKSQIEKTTKVERKVDKEIYEMEIKPLKKVSIDKVLKDSLFTKKIEEIFWENENKIKEKLVEIWGGIEDKDKISITQIYRLQKILENKKFNFERKDIINFVEKQKERKVSEVFYKIIKDSFIKKNDDFIKEILGKEIEENDNRNIINREIFFILKSYIKAEKVKKAIRKNKEEK